MQACSLCIFQIHDARAHQSGHSCQPGQLPCHACLPACFCLVLPYLEAGGIDRACWACFFSLALERTQNSYSRERLFTFPHAVICRLPGGRREEEEEEWSLPPFQEGMWVLVVGGEGKAVQRQEPCMPAV